MPERVIPFQSPGSGQICLNNGEKIERSLNYIPFQSP